VHVHTPHVCFGIGSVPVAQIHRDKEVHMPRGHKVNTKERYEKTMADMQLFKDRGFAVFYLWEHHNLIARRAKTPLGCMVKRL
jgi:hypothetical protein